MATPRMTGMKKIVRKMVLPRSRLLSSTASTSPSPNWMVVTKNEKISVRHSAAMLSRDAAPRKRNSS